MNKNKVMALALLMALCLSCQCLIGAAAEESLLDAYGMDLDLFLTYLDVSGEEMSIYPTAAGADGDTVLLWGYLPDTTVEEVTLHVSDVNGLYTFSPDEGTDLQVIDAGQDQWGKPLCEITAWSEDGETVRIRLYLSRTAKKPLVPKEEEAVSAPEEEPQKEAVLIRVHFVDTEGNTIAPDRTETVWTGQLDAVYADPIEGYVRVGDLAQMIYLPLGTKTADDVTFVYQSPEQAQEDGPAEAEGDSSEEPSGQMTEEWVEDPASLPEDGALDQPQEETVSEEFYAEENNSVTEEAAAPAVSAESEPDDYPLQTPDVNAASEAVPGPALKLIQVIYSYENDLFGYSSNKLVPVSEGEALLFAEEPKSGYQLQGEDSQLVKVYADGTAEPETVVFHYVRVAEQTPDPSFHASIPVYYQTEDGVNVATPTMETVAVGTQLVYANPGDLQDGYDLITGPQEVVCEPDGTLTPSQLVFYYRASAPEETTPPDGKNDFLLQPYSGYAKTSGSGTINLRSYPDQSDSGNIVGNISPDDLIILQQITTYKNSTWYYVSVNGRMGYVSASVVRELTDSETRALEQSMGTDEAPTPEPDEPGLIERWGKTTTKVRFREEPGGKVIRELRKNTDVFVLSLEERDQTLWYSALAAGQSGWVMAEYVELLTASQSALKQSQVKTPAPTHTPSMTRVPTATPTVFIPTPTPLPEELQKTPEPSPTPVPYTGYALSVTRAAVRSSLSLNDESVREMIAVDTLVLIQGQAYVDGACWDSVRVLSSSVTGFMQDEQLRRISDSEADYYIASLATPTPAPVILSTPEPFIGMARTLGEDVPLRTDMSSNAQIIALLGKDEVLQVTGQETAANGLTWCLAQYGQDIGYVRRDMIVQMNDWEIAGYIASLRTPTPEPVATPTPVMVSQRATAYGIVNKDRVNLRQAPSITSISLYMMTRNEMAYMLDSVLGDDGKIWYYVTVSNRTGYVSSDYLTVLKQNELDDFLNTEEFRSANNSENLINGSDYLYSYEDHLQQQWQNTDVSASFEPFNPYETPAPVLGTAQISPTPTITLPPVPSPTIVGGFLSDGDEAGPDGSGGLSLGVILLVLGGAVLLIGGTVIVLQSSRRRKKQRQALRRAQKAQSVQRARRAGSDAYDQTGLYHRDGVPSPAARYQDRAGEEQTAENGETYVRPYSREELERTRRSGAASPYRTERNMSSYPQATEDAYRPARRARRTEPNADVNGEAGATAMFRRPVRPYTESVVRETEEEDLPDEAQESSEASDPIPDLRTSSSARRRRTERFRDDPEAKD